ncbi:exodeoxyribonuclease VII large subunit [Peptoniphilus olsenii]|uniref:Exodeoxyribonuclease 7 large subunit n=1 Tax=Peptoniphilus olsenii TaxID=411570 RepID=A0ABV2J6S4_9FIRM
MPNNAIKVSELNSYIKKLLEMDYLLRNISVMGEISNLKFHSNGNIYFSLKDEKARINAKIYSADTDFDFNLEEGLEVIARGIVSYYEKEGQINFYVDDLKLNGEGNLYQNFLRLKNKLQSEGLFDSKFKKNIVKYPSTVGLITSDTGAAIRDVLNILKKRNNLIDVLVYPSFVQGKSASENVINGINYFNNKCNVDTIIIARGGGSVEDLSAFNDENLAREIFASEIPIISAIGHEVDFCISDFVSDLRAATPTNAAELVTGSKKDLIKELLDLISNLFDSLNKKIYNKKYHILNIYNRLSKNNPNTLINKEYRKLDYYERYLNIYFQKNLNLHKNKLISYQVELANFKFKDKYNQNYIKILYINLNRNIISKLNYLRNDLFYDWKFINESFLKFLNNLKSDFNYSYFILKNYELKRNFNSYYSKLNTSNKVLLKPKFLLEMKLEKSRLELYKNSLFKSLNKIIYNISFYQNNEAKTLKSLYISINRMLENSQKVLDYNFLKLNTIFNNMNKIEVKNSEGNFITNATNLTIGEEISIVFKDGIVKSEVKNKRMRSD